MQSFNVSLRGAKEEIKRLKKIKSFTEAKHLKHVRPFQMKKGDILYFPFSLKGEDVVWDDGYMRVITTGARYFKLIDLKKTKYSYRDYSYSYWSHHRIRETKYVATLRSPHGSKSFSFELNPNRYYWIQPKAKKAKK